MATRTWLKSLPALLCGVAAFACDLPRAEAFGHLFGGSSGGSSGYGSSGGSSGGYGSYGGSSGYSYGGWGSSGGGFSSGGFSSGLSSGGLFHRHRNWGGSSGGYGSSGGSSGYSYGSSGGSSGYSYGSSGGSSGGSYGGSYGGNYGGSAAPYGTNYMDAPANQAPAMPANPGAPMPPAPPSAPGAPAAPVAPAPNKAAVLNVIVPEDAKVFVNNYETKSLGTERRFVSAGLEIGRDYTYELKAEVVRDGKPVVETKVVKLQAGQTAELQFTFDGSAQPADKVVNQPTKTKLTLHVPADAKVFIAGRETGAAGEVREFATTRLAPGQAWNDYVVRVEVTRDGQVLSHEEKLTLTGGENREMHFDVGGPNLVAAK